MNNNTASKLLRICSIVCLISGLLILAISFFENEVITYSRIFLGALNIINGCLFFIISRRKF